VGWRSDTGGIEIRPKSSPPERGSGSKDGSRSNSAAGKEKKGNGKTQAGPGLENMVERLFKIETWGGWPGG